MHSLQDCINYSPALLKSNHARPLFVLYQLLNAMQHTHDQGLVLGDITLSDIIVSPELWIRVGQCYLLTIIIHYTYII